MTQPMPALFIADSIGLDFLNSVATPVDTPIDWLEDGEGLLNWLRQAKLVPDDVLDSIRARAIPGEIDRLAAQARSLREWFRTFVRAHKGHALAAPDLSELEPLNELLRRERRFRFRGPSSAYGRRPGWPRDCWASASREGARFFLCIFFTLIRTRAILFSLAGSRPADGTFGDRPMRGMRLRHVVSKL